MTDLSWSRCPDLCLDPEPIQRELARDLYTQVANLPLICPHGHVDPWLLADPDATLGTPAELFIIPDHYVFRMLYSQGIPLEALGVPRVDGGPVEQDHRRIWQIFAENFYLFRGTPSGMWLTQELNEVFGIGAKLTGATAQTIYDELEHKLAQPEFRPRALFERFHIEVLCTTDSALDDLEPHRAIRDSDWGGDVRPTFRPDAVVKLWLPDWRQNIEKLSQVSGVSVDSFAAYIRALEERRAFFKSMGALSTDHDCRSACTAELSPVEAEALFQRALKGQADDADAGRFLAHMLMEFARMSIEDGLVMQAHVGPVRNHNRPIFECFGNDRGCDVPQQIEFTHSLGPLLNKYGNDPRLTLIVFTLDESAYTRELGPLAGHYPALKIGPPWWFQDSLDGMRRYLHRIVETAGLYNTTGFADDTRAFPSIPVRHDVWRRAVSNWLAGLVVRGMVDEEDAQEMAVDAAYRLAKVAYKYQV